VGVEGSGSRELWSRDSSQENLIQSFLEQVPQLAKDLSSKTVGEVV
jgi:hypothetical protein